MKIKAVVCDWAGTTIDYGSRAPIIGFQQAFAKFGVTLDPALIRQDLGLDKRAHVQKMLEDAAIWQPISQQLASTSQQFVTDTVYKGFQETINQALVETAILKPGVSTLLAYLTKKHIAVATTSGYTQAMIEKLLPTVASQGYHPRVNITSELTGGIGRPHSAMLDLAIKRLGLTDSSGVIKVGDTINDIKEGVAAGAISVGVVEGSNLIGMSETEFTALPQSEQTQLKVAARAQFYASGANYVVTTIADVIPLIEA